jgi:MSHA biogenesis protein MshJ
VNLKEQIGALQTRIDELTLRERGILFFVIVALIYLSWNSLLVVPEEKKQTQLLGEISKMRQEIATLEQQSLEIINRHNLDPNAKERRQLKQLEQANRRLEQSITEAVEGLIEPQQMAQALESVLKKQKNFSFVRVENLGATPLIASDTDAEAQSEETQLSRMAIYKHTMRIELEGSYQNTLDYLRALEQLPWRFHWDSVELKILEYPRAQVVITVNTLSLSEGWIGV